MAAVAAAQKQAEEDRLRAAAEMAAVAAAQKQAEEDRLRAAEIAAQQRLMAAKVEEHRIADAAVEEELIAAAVVEQDRIAALQAERQSIAAEKRALAQQAQSALVQRQQMLAQCAMQEAEAAKAERAELQRQQQQMQLMQKQQEHEQQRVGLSPPNQHAMSNDGGTRAAPRSDVDVQSHSSLWGREEGQASMWESQCATLVSFYATVGAPKHRTEVETLLRKRTRQTTSSLNQHGGQPLNAPEWKRLADGLSVKYGKLPPMLFEGVDADGDGVVTKAEAITYIRSQTNFEVSDSYLASIWEVLDPNSDGVLDETEFPRFVEAVTQAAQKKPDLM
jgi:hypothetical protein